MHKRMTSIGNDEKTESVKDKSQYGIIKILALNLISISGFIQVLMFLAVIFKMMDIFTICYFIINLLICVVSVTKLLKE